MTATVVTVEPLDERRCTFTLPEGVHQGTGRFAAAAQAAGIPVVEAVFGVPGVSEVVVSGRTLTVAKEGGTPWRAVADQVLYAIETALSQRPARAAAPAQPLPDDRMYDVVERVFGAEINPQVAKHGGKVELVDVQDGIVVLRMLGGCHGCGMASVTLRQGIETSLREAIPGFRGLRDITDHATGTDPYFQKR